MRSKNHTSGERLAAAAAAWLAFIAGLLVGGEVGDVGSFAVAAVAGAVLVGVGLAAASRCRAVARHSPAQRVWILAISVVAGILLGIANLAANWMIAQRDPSIRSLLIERMAALGSLEALIGSPVVEEVLVRLFLMSVFAWLVSRLTGHTRLSFVVALIASALVFAALHLARPFPGDPALANYYRLTLLVKYTLAGLPLGWIFWRFGLPYAIACHVAANASHFALQRAVF